MIIDFNLKKLERHFLEIYNEALEYGVELNSVAEEVDGVQWMAFFEGGRVRKLENLSVSVEER